LSHSTRYIFLIIAYVFSSTKLEKRAKEVLPGSKGAAEEREEVGGRGEKCMHIGIKDK
jgi:hypothetical protein